MKFDRLRLSGFKSFVDPVDFDIFPGMSGIVGPNGCGKSNLLEALRWVMGETSYKSMRGAGMEDVIFSGTDTRASRNHAEVVLFLDNQARIAPAEYNDANELEVTRRIERGSGSAYQINGRDVRTRDVQLLFADASTGARSNSLVRQGQIGELINAKPETRRHVLEEAAGISGLHARRHEAELRLRGAGNNLEKLEDTISNLETQLRQLKRQTRQASRYKNISGQIREIEALVLHLHWQQACDLVAESETALIAARQTLSEATRIDTQTSTVLTNAQASLPGLRNNEAEAAAALRRITMERDGLEAQASRAVEKVAWLAEQIALVNKNSIREKAALDDATQQISSLTEEETASRASIGDDESAAEKAARDHLDSESEKLTAVQLDYDGANSRLASYNARRHALTRSLADNAARCARLKGEQSKTQNARADIEAAMQADFDLVARRAQMADGETAYQAAAAHLAQAEMRYSAAREAHQQANDPAREARADLARLTGERDALGGVFAAPLGIYYAPLLNAVKVAAGYEIALGAALGDDLEASAEINAPRFWLALGEQVAPQALPDGVCALNDFVSGTRLLRRALSQVGVVERAAGTELQTHLLPGQRLVSRQGDIWRWDGYCATADAPGAAARRLAQRNRLEALATEITQAEELAISAQQNLDQTREAFEVATQAQDVARHEAHSAQQELTSLQKELAQAEASVETQTARLQALKTAEARLQSDLEEINKTDQAVQADLHALEDVGSLEAALETVRGVMEASHAAHAAAQAALHGLQRQREERNLHLNRIKADIISWQQRFATASQQVAALQARTIQAEEEKQQFESVPAALADKRAAMADLVQQAQNNRRRAGEVLAAAENKLAGIGKQARQTQITTADARETQARLEATLDANRQQLEEAGQRIRKALQIEPEQALATSGHDLEKPFPQVAAMEQTLEKLRRERETLGGVNLRAEAEATEVGQQIDDLIGERDDLSAAINKLRHAVGQLNREGRQRLLAAFEAVDRHFQRLFTQLFGGGSAKLELTENDDPLQAGLEIIAHPPGKKPQVMSLLSGGEQALTAMALIFAVFLTNPSPICVLDEVDAPLDDANVERFCNLVKEIADQTDTRFLVITHHALTMARMDRLFGVTMQERGVSQLLSVDLSTAGQFAETGRKKTASQEENKVKSNG